MKRELSFQASRTSASITVVTSKTLGARELEAVSAPLIHELVKMLPFPSALRAEVTEQNKDKNPTVNMSVDMVSRFFIFISIIRKNSDRNRINKD